MQIAISTFSYDGMKWLEATQIPSGHNAKSPIYVQLHLRRIVGGSFGFFPELHRADFEWERHRSPRPDTDVSKAG